MTKWIVTMTVAIDNTETDDLEVASALHALTHAADIIRGCKSSKSRVVVDVDEEFIQKNRYIGNLNHIYKRDADQPGA